MSKKALYTLLLYIILTSCGKLPFFLENSKKITNEKQFFEHSGHCNLDSLCKESKIQNKPVLLYFTGYGCVNNRKMEDQIFIYKDVHDLMHEKFIPFALYVDAYSTKFDPPHRSMDGLNDIKSLGDENTDLQRTLFNTNYQPQFVIIRADTSIVAQTGYTMSKSDFKDFLLQALKDF